ncbi:methyltransferase domain-containing protein [Pseudothauera nasutitermitis]|jgi:SAM-dependent methyltransferase|uniref:Arsenite methyltransferase n=1 Tax=Pseudothauera nasutitermitis TaxID=2565930 RepID=A0A4S4B1E3_9RHOO|nr:methyltransferase domain-containing protein [Pseudothauera nasutitermitis]THF66354.1 methyltransferase domain-containing protein [Pseudothauera nasutitermitis]
MNNQAPTLERRIEEVQHYYGDTLTDKQDLATNVCTADEPPSDAIKAILTQIHDDVQMRFYGCGAPFPPLLEGATVLDLGCGGGRDCFVLSSLVGERGKVIGVDATAEQIAFAQSYVEHHRKVFGHTESNVRFLQGNIEALDQLDLPPESIDVIVSNCVINLSMTKADVLAGMAKLLKPGGEIYFADIFSDRRLAPELKDDPLIVGECIGDALYFEDFVRLAQAAGFLDVRVTAKSLKTIANPAIEAKLGGAKLYSITLRLFKMDLEDRCEDYGQVAIYKGNLPEAPDRFVLDNGHAFDTGRAVPVCRNTADMISKSRYRILFDVIGDGRRHYGLFQCGTPQIESVPTLADVGVCGPAGCGC